MADPTIQTFCCHKANGTDMAVTIMQEFNTKAYNLVCIFSSTIGILGALYQILPRQQFSNTHQWLSLSASRGRKIIVWLAVADLFASIGVLFRSSLWLNYRSIMPGSDDNFSVIFCAVFSAFIQYFYTSTWIWTLCYALDMRLVLTEKESRTKLYHLAAWIIPGISTVFGLTLLYFPDANCHTSHSLETALLRILPNYFATYIPMTVVMIANPILYKYSTKDMERIITGVSGQFTSREREILEAIKLKFWVINIIFYVCWTPNLVNGVLLWAAWFHLPDGCVIVIWYIMAFINPLQALFNCLVYRRWTRGSERIIIPWRKLNDSTFVKSETLSNTGDTSVRAREEILPLLKSSATATTSINGETTHLRKSYNT